MSELENEKQGVNLSEMNQSIRQFISEGKMSVGGTTFSGEMFDLYLEMLKRNAVEEAIPKHVERVNQLALATKERMKEDEATIHQQREENSKLRIEKEGLRNKLELEQQRANQWSQWYQQQVGIEKQSMAAQIQSAKAQHLNELGKLRLEVESERIRASIQEKMREIEKQYPGLKAQAEIEPKLIDAGIHIGQEVVTQGLRHLLGTKQP